MEENKIKNRILLCEDDLTSRLLLSTVLKKRGYVIVGEAETGIEAINLYDQMKPDIVLLDIQMPKGGGITTLRFMRELNKEPYIIMLTGDDTPHSVNTTKSLGANEYVLKTSVNDASFLDRLAVASGLYRIEPLKEPSENKDHDDNNDNEIKDEEMKSSESKPEGNEKDIAKPPDFEPIEKSKTPRRMVRYKRQ